MGFPEGPDSLSGHFFSPRNVGRAEAPCREGRAENAACGDELELTLRVECGRVTEARFLAKGCSALIAVASLLTEELAGATLEAARGLDVPRLVEERGGLPPRAQHAPRVAGRALAQALRADPGESEHRIDGLPPWPSAS